MFLVREFRSVSLILFFMLVFVLVLSSLALAKDCCVPPYEGDSTYGIDWSPNGDSTFCTTYYTNFVYNKTCGTEIEPNMTVLATGCCCNTNSCEPLDLSGYGQFLDTIYKANCESFQDYQFTGSPGDDCVAICQNLDGCTSGGTGDDEFNISGHVYLADGTQNTPLEQIEIEALSLSAFSNEEGYYNLENVPLGTINLVASAPAPIELNGDLYTCQSQEYPMTVTSNMTHDFYLACEVQQAPCEPDWQVSDWGECVPYGSQMVQFREVWDSNECDNPINQPPSINYTACEQTGYYEACNNGSIDSYEVCDSYDGTTDFLLNDGTIVSKDSITCEDILGPQWSGDITCAQCQYNFTACSSSCGTDCDMLQKCASDAPVFGEDGCQLEGGCYGCEACIGDPLCGDECQDVAPMFLFENPLNSFFTGTRNIYDLYTNQTPEEQARSTIFYTKGTKDVTLSWEFTPTTCQNKIIGYTPSLCKEKLDDDGKGTNTCVYNSEISAYNVGGSTTTHTFVNVLEPNTSYCYNVCLLDDAGNTKCAYEQDDDGTIVLPCFKTGDEECMTPHDDDLQCLTVTNDDGIGDDSGAYGCSQYSHEHPSWTNLLLEKVIDCDTNDMCIEIPEEPWAVCQQQGNCSSCNGLFGLFSEYNLQSHFTIDNGNGNKVILDDCQKAMFNYDTNNHLPAANNYIGTCYQDRSLSTHEVYASCSHIKTCYDYKSEDACNTDYCFKFHPDGTNLENNDCEWKSYDDELGIGVCAPKKQADETCFKCDTDSPIGFCNENLCGLYGEGCSFKETKAHGTAEDNILLETGYHNNYVPTCIHERDMACYLYNTPSECNAYSSDSALNVSVDVIYNDDFEGLYGSNKILNKSYDMYGTGVCVWNDQNGCYRNADGKYLISNGEPIYQDDCLEGGSATLDCLQDYTPPTTSILLRDASNQPQHVSELFDTEGNPLNDSGLPKQLPVYGKNQLNDIQIVSTDDVSADKNVKTKVAILPVDKCMAEGCIPPLVHPGNFTRNLSDKNSLQSCFDVGCDLYPRHSFDEYINDPNLQEQTIRSGEHILMYYSFDEAKNLELVNFTTFFIDNTSPEIIGPEIILNSFNNGFGYATNLTINFNTSETAWCDGTLIQLPEQSGFFGDIQAHGTEFSSFYLALQDGHYNYDITCHDDYDNNVQVIVPILIEADKSITNPQPFLKTYRYAEEVNLSLETRYNGSCRLDEENVPYADSKYHFPQTNAIEHNMTLFNLFDQMTGTANANESKPFWYQASCLFDDGNITEQTPGDVISFTIDQLPPLTYITKPGGQEIYDPVLAEWSDNKSLEIHCTDKNSQTPVGYFTCNATTYCFGEYVNTEDFNQSTDCNEGTLVTDAEEWPIVLDESTLSFENVAYDYLYYYSKDDGGNIEDVHRVDLKIKNTHFGKPIITLIE